MKEKELIYVPDLSVSYGGLKNALNIQGYDVVLLGDKQKLNDKKMIEDNVKEGGFAVGPSHDDGGIPGYVKSTGQTIEFEGGESIINKRSMAMNQKVVCEGTPKGVASAVNMIGGGVKFSEEGTCKIVSGQEAGTTSEQVYDKNKDKLERGNKLKENGDLILKRSSDSSHEYLKKRFGWYKPVMEGKIYEIIEGKLDICPKRRIFTICIERDLGTETKSYFVDVEMTYEGRDNDNIIRSSGTILNFTDSEDNTNVPPIVLGELNKLAKEFIKEFNYNVDDYDNDYFDLAGEEEDEPDDYDEYAKGGGVGIDDLKKSFFEGGKQGMKAAMGKDFVDFNEWAKQNKIKKTKDLENAWIEGGKSAFNMAKGREHLSFEDWIKNKKFNNGGGVEDYPSNYYLHAIELDNGKIYKGKSYYDIVSNQPTATFPIDERTMGYVDKEGNFYGYNLDTDEWAYAKGGGVGESKITLKPEEVWEKWNTNQKENFLKSHQVKLGQIAELKYIKYFKHLPEYIKSMITQHLKKDISYSKGKGISESKSIYKAANGMDVESMPIIGQVTTKEFKLSTGEGGLHFLVEGYTYDVVSIGQRDGHTYYVTNKWYKKHKQEPLIIVDEIVEKYNPY